MRARAALVVIGLLVTSPASAAPAPTTLQIEGQVMTTSSRWTADGSRIVTEAIVRTAAGDVIVSQLGGSVGGLAMRTYPGPEPLVSGMRVAVSAHADVDLGLRPHVVVDAVRVMADPPGFVRSGPTKAGKYLYWEGGCVYVTVDAAGTKQIPGDQELDVVDASIAEWNTRTAACSYFQIQTDGREEVEVGRDMRNVIKFRDATWCRPAIGDDPIRCYSPDAAGLTTAVFVDDETSPRDGAIVDADIELNGTGDLEGGFALSIDGMTLGIGTCLSDIANTLTHELGHLQGIEHTCRTRADPSRVDDRGAVVPLCEATSDPEITEATMYNFAECGETEKASLTQDDVDAMCAVYPLAMDPGSCERVEDGGCCSTSSDHGWPAATASLGLAIGACLLRRRRPPRA